MLNILIILIVLFIAYIKRCKIGIEIKITGQTEFSKYSIKYIIIINIYIYFFSVKIYTEEDLEVEKILGIRERNGITEYYLKWTGFDDTHNSWEPESNLDCDKLIKKFKKKNEKNERREKRKNKRKNKKCTKQSLQLKPNSDNDKVLEEIICVTESDDQLKYLVKWAQMEEYDLVLASKINELCPKTVIKFYEHELKWCNNTDNNDDDNDDSKDDDNDDNEDDNNDDNKDNDNDDNKDDDNDDDCISENIESVNNKIELHSGKIPEKVIGTTIYKGQFLYLIKWKNLEETDLISSKVASVIFPQTIIKFYLDKIDWLDD